MGRTVMHEERLFLSTTPGLDEALEREARALGPVERVQGGIELLGSEGLHRRANLHLRCASRVLLRVGEVRGADARARAEAWRRVAANWPLAVVRRASVRAETRGVALREDRLVDEFTSAWGGERVKEESADEILLRASPEGITVSIDTSGEPLHRRGYRQEVSHAPLRETLAAGILGLADYAEDEPLVDPMCGSGTFVIEAALISTRRAPGLSRGFAFDAWSGFDAAAWQREREEATRLVRTAPSALVGTDLHSGSLGTARRNARRAGVFEEISLERRDIRAARPPEGKTGLVVANPPYGIRVGEKGDLPALFRALGETLRGNFKGWRAAVLVPDAKLGAALALPLPKRHALQNGGIRLELQVAEL